MKKIFGALKIIINILCGFLFIRMLAGYEESVLTKVCLWIWCIFTMINCILGAANQFAEMRIVNKANKHFAYLKSSSSGFTKEELIKKVTLFINVTDDIINNVNLKPYNQEYLKQLQSQAKELLPPELTK